MKPRPRVTPKARPALTILASTLGSRSTRAVSAKKASLTASRTSPVWGGIRQPERHLNYLFKVGHAVGQLHLRQSISDCLEVEGQQIASVGEVGGGVHHLENVPHLRRREAIYVVDNHDDAPFKTFQLSRDFGS